MLMIDSLPIPNTPAVLGLSRCPGTGVGNPLDRQGNLRQDIALIRQWGAAGVLTLNETQELKWLGVETLGETVREAKMDWWHCPIPDFGAPGAGFEARYGDHIAAVIECLASGQRVLLHCLAGLGRSGTMAARILVQNGMEPEQAVRNVRAARPGSVQSESQMRYLLERRWLEDS